MKKVTLILFIVILAGVTFLFLTSNSIDKNASTTPANTINSTVTKKTIQMLTAEHFFQAYAACLKKPPSEATGNETTYCVTATKDSTDKLLKTIEKQKLPVTCSQTLPQSASAVRSTEINDNQAIVILSENSGQKKINVTYQMQRVKGEWKVENILCPR
jgi:hypothetical protein